MLPLPALHSESWPFPQCPLLTAFAHTLSLQCLFLLESGPSAAAGLHGLILPVLSGPLPAMGSAQALGNFRYLLLLPLFLPSSPSKSSQLLWKAGITLTLVYQDEAHTRKAGSSKGTLLPVGLSELKTLLAPCCCGRL